MKILYLITKSNWGGASKYVYDLALEAKQRNLDVTVTAGGTGELLTKLGQAGIRTIPLPSVKRDIQFLGEFNNLWQLVRLFKSEKPDVIHLNSSKIGGLGSLAGRLAGVPKIIFTGHGWAFNERRFFLSKWLIALGHWVTILLSRLTIAVSEKTAGQLRKFPGAKNKIITIYNGLDVPQFLNRDEAREKLSPADKETVWVGTIAELHTNKGLDILITAFKKVLSSIPGINLMIIGEGEERENLARLIAKNQLTNNVNLLGRRENASQYLPAFDIFILPSRTEALPYALLEAGGAGLPVVAAKVGGIPEIIENEVSGILVPKENAEALAEAITTLLTNKNLADDYGQKLKQTILTKFSKQKMLDQTFTLYQQ